LESITRDTGAQLYNVSTLTTEAECPSETPAAIDKVSWCGNADERTVNIPSRKNGCPEEIF
jgi:hypothetical protein